MASGPLLLALDQGTTSTRAILFDIAGTPLRTAQRELRQIYPAAGWVEHDPEEIWEASVQVLRDAAGDTLPAAIGITNQRETVLLWDRATGACLHNAIVWQDRRTAPVCDRLRADGLEPFVAERSGLLIDPLFLGDQARLAAGRPARRARTQRPRLRHGRQLPGLAAHRRPGPRHRRDKRRAHQSLRYPHLRLEPGAARAFRRARVPAAGGARQRHRLRHHGHSGRARAGRGYGRRSARGNAGPGLPGGRATSRAPTAPAASCWPTPAPSRSPRVTGCSPPSPSASTAGPPTRSKAPSSLPARRCNGCATGWA